YASAGDLAADLNNLLTGRPIKARRVGVVERVVKWGRRHPTAAALIAAGLLVALLAGLDGYERDRVRRMTARREALEFLRRAHEDIQASQTPIVKGQASSKELICEKARAALSALGIDPDKLTREPGQVFARYDGQFQSREARQQAVQQCCEILLA